MPRARPHSIPRAYRTRADGIFRKASELFKNDSSIKIFIFIKKAQDPSFMFAAGEHEVWPSGFYDHARQHEPTFKGPTDFMTASEAILQGKIPSSISPFTAPQSPSKSSSNPASRRRMYKNRTTGIFKKSSELAELAPSIEIFIFCKRPGDLSLMFATGEKHTWPKPFYDYAIKSNPTIKRPSNFTTVSDAISKGKLLLDRPRSSSPSEPELPPNFEVSRTFELPTPNISLSPGRSLLPSEREALQEIWAQN